MLRRRVTACHLKNLASSKVTGAPVDQKEPFESSLARADFPVARVVSHDLLRPRRDSAALPIAATVQIYAAEPEIPVVAKDYANATALRLIDPSITCLCLSEGAPFSGIADITRPVAVNVEGQLTEPACLLVQPVGPRMPYRYVLVRTQVAYAAFICVRLFLIFFVSLVILCVVV